ncbi:MAG: hypothetical protein PHR35_04230 [Kiritimatiellae bacterium]|nr:hypothetical protein [Kiritimatiellia bacterium]
MNEVAAQHLLGIYRLRLEMAESGTTHPAAGAVAGVRRLVAGLEAMSPDAKVKSDALPGKYTFRDALTGLLIAEIEFDVEAEPSGGEERR